MDGKGDLWGVGAPAATLPPDDDVADRTPLQVPIQLREMSGSPSGASMNGYPIAHWDRYEFLGLLGRGGMGAVYKARDRQLGRMVALKFIHGTDLTMNQRFLQEARAQARLVHPNICQVYEVGQVENHPYIAMELVRGLPLDQAGKSMSLTEKLQVIKAAAEAMHAAHEEGVIHRDIKPSEIAEPLVRR